MSAILDETSFVCHKDTTKQCAGHMLIRGDKNEFITLSKSLNLPLNLSGEELVFDDEESCIEHHKNNWSGK